MPSMSSKNLKLKLKCKKDSTYMFMHYKENLFTASIFMEEIKLQQLNLMKIFMSSFKSILKLQYSVISKFIIGQMTPLKKYFNTLFQWPTSSVKMNFSSGFALVISKNVLILQSFWNLQRYRMLQWPQLVWNKLFLCLSIDRHCKKLTMLKMLLQFLL